MHILVLNAGSSSQKSRLYRLPDQVVTKYRTGVLASGEGSGGSREMPATAPLWTADADWSNSPGKVSLTITARGRTVKQELPNGGHAEILPRMLQTLWQGEMAVLQQPSEIDIVGHRIVHGGAHYQHSVVITPQVENDLRQ